MSIYNRGEYVNIIEGKCQGNLRQGTMSDQRNIKPTRAFCHESHPAFQTLKIKGCIQFSPHDGTKENLEQKKNSCFAFLNCDSIVNIIKTIRLSLIFQTRPNIVVSKLIKMLDDYGLHIASGMERDDISVTAFTKNLAATIVKPNRHVKVLWAPLIYNIEWEGRESKSRPTIYFRFQSQENIFIFS